MKRLCTLLLLLVVAAPSWAIDVGAMPACAGYDSDLTGCPVYIAATECKILTADGVVSDDAGRLVAVYVSGITANDDVLLYDNASAASGTVLLNGLNLPAGFPGYPIYPAPFTNGVYADVTLTTGNVTVCYTN